MSTGISMTVHCRQCLKPMGLIDDDELVALVHDNPEGGCCFDCEPDACDRIPAFFVEWRSWGVTGIGDIIFEPVVNGDGFYRLVPSRARARMRVHMRARGLSSSTYLNRTLHNTVNGVVEVGDGQGVTEDLPGWVLVPTWLLEGGAK